MQNKPKICHIASIDMTVKFLLLPQLKFLMGEGYEVYVVCSGGKLTDEIKKEGLNVKTIQITRKMFSPLSDVIAFFKLYAYFKKEKFMIVHTHAPKPGLLGQWAARLAGVPVIINTIHGLYFTDDSSLLKRKIFIFIEKFSAQFSDFIFSQNKEDITTIAKEKIADSNKVGYLGNGINLSVFNSERFTEDVIKTKKEKLGLPQDHQIIGMVGRLVREKGYPELFEAMKEVIKKHPKTLLLSIGPKEPDKKDKFGPEVVKEYGIEKNVIFLGQREDIVELYPLMDVFVLPSHREGFPRSVIEAMAMARPIIVTDIRGCREEIDNGENGIIIPVKNPQKLAEAIIELLENKDKAKMLAQHAKMKAVAEFDENIIFSRIKEQYSRLLKEKLIV